MGKKIKGLKGLQGIQPEMRARAAAMRAEFIARWFDRGMSLADFTALFDKHFPPEQEDERVNIPESEDSDSGC